MSGKTEQGKNVSGEYAEAPDKETSQLQIYWTELSKWLAKLDFRKGSEKVVEPQFIKEADLPLISPEEKEQRVQKILDAIQAKLTTFTQTGEVFLGEVNRLEIRIRLETLSNQITPEDAQAIRHRQITFTDPAGYITVIRTITGVDINEPEKGYVFNFLHTSREESELLRNEAEELQKRLISNLEYQSLIPGTETVEYHFSGFKNPFVLNRTGEDFYSDVWAITNMQVDNKGSYISLRLRVNGL